MRTCRCASDSGCGRFGAAGRPARRSRIAGGCSLPRWEPPMACRISELARTRSHPAHPVAGAGRPRGGSVGITAGAATWCCGGRPAVTGIWADPYPVTAEKNSLLLLARQEAVQAVKHLRPDVGPAIEELKHGRSHHLFFHVAALRSLFVEGFDQLAWQVIRTFRFFQGLLLMARETVARR